MERPDHSVSDAELKRLLSSLKEEPAAPPGFRVRIQERLLAQGLIAAPAARARPGLFERLAAAFQPARFGLVGAGAAALAVGLWMLPTPAQRQAPEAPRLLASASPVPPRAAARKAPSAPARSRAQALAAAPDPAPARSFAVPAAAPGGEALAEAPSASPLAAAAQPAAQAPALPAARPMPAQLPAASSAAPSFSGQAAAPGGAPSQAVAAAQSKPEALVAKPSPTPLAVALRGVSELRNNVVRASRGEAALLLFQLAQGGAVRAEVFSRLGRSVALLKDGELPAGLHELRWAGQSEDGTLAPSGVYILVLRTPGFEARHKLVLVK